MVDQSRVLFVDPVHLHTKLCCVDLGLTILGDDQYASSPLCRVRLLSRRFPFLSSADRGNFIWLARDWFIWIELDFFIWVYIKRDLLFSGFPTSLTIEAPHLAIVIL